VSWVPPVSQTVAPGAGSIVVSSMAPAVVKSPKRAA
jgi:hypothetical protein